MKKITFSVSLRAVCLLLCAALLLPMLSGCDLEQEITDRLASYDETKSFPIPEIRTLKNREQVEHSIFDYYIPLVRTLERAEDHGFLLRHDITRDGSCISVKSYVTDAGGGRWDITEIAVYTDGTVYLPDMGDISYLSDGDFLHGCLTLCRSGYFANPSRYGETMSCGQVYSEMIRFYEMYSGQEIDYSRMAQSYSGSPDYLKAAELFMDFVSSDLYYDTTIDADGIFFTDASSKLLAEMLFAPCGVSSTSTRVQDMLELCKMFFSFLNPVGPGEISSDWTAKRDAFIKNAENITYLDVSSNRDIIAQCFHDLYKDTFGPLTDIPTDITFDDSGNRVAVTCVNAGFMEEFPNEKLFSGEFVYYYGALPAAAERYVVACYDRWSGGRAYECSLDYTDFISYLGRLTEYADAFPDRSASFRTVMNDRGLDFYLKQHDGTQYQHVNCMPTITAMAYKWYNNGGSITPSQVRALFLPESTEGWYMWQVEEALDKYRIPHESYDIGIENMAQVLDSGRIILTQMSETNLDYSGHCLLIYGYKSCGDSFRFWCHDPGMDGGENKYGGPRGEGIVRDGGYIYFIVDRFAYSFVGVGDEKAVPQTENGAESEAAPEDAEQN